MDHITHTLPAGPGGASRGISGNDLLWSVLRNLRDCQPSYGIGSRDVETLQALIGFLKGQSHQMVFASNRKILARMNGISVKTLQRSIARLVEAGLILRRDSANGKRFVTRSRGSSEAQAFGFDLSPLIEKEAEIAWHAEEHREETIRCGMLKQRLRALLNRLKAALPCHGLIATVSASLRRKLRSDQIEILAAAVEAELICPLEQADRMIRIVDRVIDAAELSPDDSQNDAHHHRSNTDNTDKTAEKDEIGTAAGTEPERQIAAISFDDIKTACPEALSYCPAPPSSWPELREIAMTMAGWLGIAPDLSKMAQRHLGPDGAALTVLCIIQSASDIRNPAAYLRSLCSGPHATGFDPVRWLRRLGARTSSA